MKKTFTRETTIALFNEADLPIGLNYKNLFDTVESSINYTGCVDFYYNEDGTICFFKIFDKAEFLIIAKLDFIKKTFNLLDKFLNQTEFKDYGIIFYNYRA